MGYTIQAVVSGEFDAVVDTTTEALSEEGFGVLTEIDVQATFEEKLNEEFRQYRILGACNPPLASKGLAEEIDLGALLPCNVVVYERDDGDIVVGAVDPNTLLEVPDNEDLEPIATEVTERFNRVLAAVRDEFDPAE